MVTVKAASDVAMSPLTVTEIGPVVAAAGTDVVMDVLVAAVTTADTPLNNTRLPLVSELKLLPLMVTTVPAGPVTGVKSVITGGCNTVKTFALVAIKPSTTTARVPVTAPFGTTTLNEVEDALVMLATVPLNVTWLLTATELKLVPINVTVVPAGPLSGLNDVMVGGNSTLKSSTEVAVNPLTLTLTLPVVAPVGTVVVMLVDVELVTVVWIPLNRTSL